MRVLSDRGPLSSLLSRPFAALMLFGAVGIVAMVVTFSVARGVAARPAPVVVSQPPAAASAPAPNVSAPPTVDPGQAAPVYAPPVPGNGNAYGHDGGRGD